ncbi:MAG TPA: 50S ribosomal protein L23 [Vicingus sp.]|nr:50S ribosomal protein L23 [Vicingus sp.]HRP58802.1 50S ribosomal protein L23 [Vicingus sp.]
MSVIVKPVVTEKMTNLTEKLNRYGFIVDYKSNKIQVKKAVEEMYAVTVDSVNTMNYYGKAKSRFTKAGLVSGRTNKFKKAIITLAEGDSIDFYSNI